MTLSESTRALLAEWGLRAAILGVGWLGAQTILPGWRVSMLEAKVENHLVWATAEQKRISDGLADNQRLIEALIRLQCYRLGADSPLLRVANLPCAEVFANQVPAR